MRKSTIYQNKIKKLLTEYFSEVGTEWSIAKGSTGRFKLKSNYAPRLDVAVGPFNIGNHITTSDIERGYDKSPEKLKGYIRGKNLKRNKNPRCTLAVEVVFSGSSKHILGDIANASIMGLYGFVVASNIMYEKVNRVYNYLQVVKSLDKTPRDLFENVLIINTSNFANLLKAKKTKK